MNKGMTPEATGLPKKEWLTLEEIARRWGTETEMLIHHGIFGAHRKEARA